MPAAFTWAPYSMTCALSPAEEPVQPFQSMAVGSTKVLRRM